MALRDSVLGTSLGYRLFRSVIRANRSTRIIVEDYVRLPPNGRLLDIGCGNGDLARFIPTTAQYVGVDHNSAYVQAATRSHNNDRVRFVDADIAELADIDCGTFDVIVALGVIHHLDDLQATDVLGAARELLTPNGHLVLVEPTFHPDQANTARVLMALDRGRFVRHPSHYDRLLEPFYTTTKVTLRHDLNPFPYTHYIVEASNP